MRQWAKELDVARTFRLIIWAHKPREVNLGSWVGPTKHFMMDWLLGAHASHLVNLENCELETDIRLAVCCQLRRYALS